MIRRKFDLPAAQFQVPVQDRPAQSLHLAAGVVDVVLPLDVIPGRVQHPGQGVAHGRAPAVAHVQRAGGVGRHEFHLDLAAAAQIGPAEIGPEPDHFGRHAAPPFMGQGKVDEPRAGRFHPVDEPVRVFQIFDDQFGQVPGGFFRAALAETRAALVAQSP